MVMDLDHRLHLEVGHHQDHLKIVKVALDSQLHPGLLSNRRAQKKVPKAIPKVLKMVVSPPKILEHLEQKPARIVKIMDLSIQVLAAPTRVLEVLKVDRELDTVVQNLERTTEIQQLEEV